MGDPTGAAHDPSVGVRRRHLPIGMGRDHAPSSSARAFGTSIGAWVAAIARPPAAR
jgi:hypothetical protein